MVYFISYKVIFASDFMFFLKTLSFFMHIFYLNECLDFLRDLIDLKVIGIDFMFDILWDCAPGYLRSNITVNLQIMNLKKKMNFYYQIVGLYCLNDKIRICFKN